jgi:hypothetical protein
MHSLLLLSKNMDGDHSLRIAVLHTCGERQNGNVILRTENFAFSFTHCGLPDGAIDIRIPR